MNAKVHILTTLSGCFSSSNLVQSSTKHLCPLDLLEILSPCRQRLVESNYLPIVNSRRKTRILERFPYSVSITPMHPGIDLRFSCCFCSSSASFASTNAVGPLNSKSTNWLNFSLIVTCLYTAVTQNSDTC